jgi:flagellar protein FliS
METTTMDRTAAYLESRILSADPVELTGILYEQAIVSVKQARESLAKKEIAERSRKISKAIAILSELDASLDHKVGGEISRNLARLYHYIRERLLTANFQQVDEPLAEAESLLNTLAEGWEAVKRATAAASGDSPAPAPVTTPEETNSHFSTPFFLDAGSYSQAHAWTA